MKFNGVKLTEESILKARQWYVDNARGCIEEVQNGSVKVNDPEAYIKWREKQIEDALAGRYDHTLAFLQRAYYIQTGECVALLP